MRFKLSHLPGRVAIELTPDSKTEAAFLSLLDEYSNLRLYTGRNFTTGKVLSTHIYGSKPKAPAP